MAEMSREADVVATWQTFKGHVSFSASDRQLSILRELGCGNLIVHSAAIRSLEAQPDAGEALWHPVGPRTNPPETLGVIAYRPLENGGHAMNFAWQASGRWSPDEPWTLWTHEPALPSPDQRPERRVVQRRRSGPTHDTLQHSRREGTDRRKPTERADK